MVDKQQTTIFHLHSGVTNVREQFSNIWSGWHLEFASNASKGVPNLDLSKDQGVPQYLLYSMVLRDRTTLCICKLFLVGSPRPWPFSRIRVSLNLTFPKTSPLSWTTQYSQDIANLPLFRQVEYLQAGLKGFDLGSKFHSGAAVLITFVCRSP